MNCKNSDLEISSDDPFKNCCLKRKPYAEALESIVSNYSTGFVLAINGEWGTGKTTFVKMWQANLKKNGFHTIYFNAWENDFISDPIVALLGELKSAEPNFPKIESLLTSGGKVAKCIMKGVITNYFGKETTEAIKEIGEVIVKPFLEEEIANYENSLTEIKHFRTDFEEYVSVNCKDKPLVFIVDELDRCAPSYAVKVLERIKHLFSVEGIVYVLSIDKVQLANSVKGYYGSDLINADDYLRRFIDVEYTLPLPCMEDYCKYLYSYFQFEKYKFDDFMELITSLCNDKNLSLRQVEKIFSQLKIAFSLCPSFVEKHSELLLLLSYLKLHYPDLYEKLKKKKLTIQELVFKLEEAFPQAVQADLERYRWVIGDLLFYYYSSFNTGEQKRIGGLLTNSSTGSNDLAFTLNKFNKKLLLESVEWKKDGRISLDILICKIDFFENVKAR